MASEQAEAVDLVASDTVKQLSGAVLFAALTAVLAKFSIPIGPVPFSFQPFGVFFAGLILGPVWGGCALLLYYVVGLAGAPVFATGGGIGYALGPKGGFLIGFILSAIVIGFIAHRSPTPKPVAELSINSSTIGLLAGLIVIYLIGLPWFVEVQGWSLLRGVSFFTPFAVGDLIKIAITVGIIDNGNKLLSTVQ